MLKSLLFLGLRIAAGYFLVTIIFMLAAGHLPKEAYEASSYSIIYRGFYLATLVAWMVGTVFAVGEFAGAGSPRLRPFFAWAPLYLPLIYALGAYLWFSRLAF